MPLDLTPLRQLDRLRRMGDRKVAGELAKMFLSRTPERLASMRRALAGGDAEALVHLAHSLGGSCGVIGARGMAALCRRPEGGGAGEALESAGEVLPDPGAGLVRVRALMAAEPWKE